MDKASVCLQERPPSRRDNPAFLPSPPSEVRSQSNTRIRKSKSCTKNTLSPRTLSKFSVLPSIGTNKDEISIAIKIPPNGERKIINTTSQDTINEMLRNNFNISNQQYILIKPILNERIEDFTQTLQDAGIQDKSLLYLQTI